MDLTSKVTVVTVNYNTPDLLYGLLGSLRQFLDTGRVIVVNNSEECLDRARYGKGLRGFKCIETGANIGHGPAMHVGIVAADTPQVLTLDTDTTLLRDGLLTYYADALSTVPTAWYGAGNVTLYTMEGVTHRPKEEGEVSYGRWSWGWPVPMAYLHPYCALINRAQYLRYARFEDHGAPCLSAMLHLAVMQPQRRPALINMTGLDEYVHHAWRGTRDKVSVPSYRDVV